MSKTYTLVLERDAESGWWSAHLAELPGVITQGKTLATVRERVREALAAWLDDEAAAERTKFVDDIRIGAKVLKAVEVAKARREEYAKAEAASNVAMRAAARALLEKGLSTRDASELLGVSHQRVAQLAELRS